MDNNELSLWGYWPVYFHFCWFGGVVVFPAQHVNEDSGKHYVHLTLSIHLVFLGFSLNRKKQDINTDWGRLWHTTKVPCLNQTRVFVGIWCLNHLSSDTTQQQHFNGSNSSFSFFNSFVEFNLPFRVTVKPAFRISEAIGQSFTWKHCCHTCKWIINDLHHNFVFLMCIPQCQQRRCRQYMKTQLHFCICKYSVCYAC